MSLSRGDRRANSMRSSRIPTISQRRTPDCQPKKKLAAKLALSCTWVTWRPIDCRFIVIVRCMRRETSRANRMWASRSCRPLSPFTYQRFIIFILDRIFLSQSDSKLLTNRIDCPITFIIANRISFFLFLFSYEEKRKRTNKSFFFQIEGSWRR